MENDSPVVETEAPVETQQETTEETEVEETQEKPKETPEQKVARLRRQLQRAERDLGVEEEPAKISKKSSADFDYGQRAFLKASGINGAEEVALVKTFVQRTGDDLDVIVEDDIFQARLQKLRANRETKAAIPPTSKRGSQATSDSVEYWMGKPFAEVPENMKRQVLNERLKRESNHTL